MKIVDINEKIARARVRTNIISIERANAVQAQIAKAKADLSKADDKDKTAIASTIATLEDRMKTMQDQLVSRGQSTTKIEKQRADAIQQGREKAASVAHAAKQAQERLNDAKEALKAKQEALKAKQEAAARKVQPTEEATPAPTEEAAPAPTEEAAPAPAPEPIEGAALQERWCWGKLDR